MKTPQILTSFEYGLFGMLSGNRPLNKKKIEKIKEDVSKGLNLLPYCPVIVFKKDEQLLVIDGQHRFNVSKQLEMPVYYVVSEELSLYEIAMMNGKQEKWKEADFLNCYVELNNEHYLSLKNFTRDFNGGIAVIAELLMHGSYLRRKEVMENFREGLFTSNFPEETTALLTLTNQLFGRYTFGSDRNLTMAVQKLQEKGLCDFDHLLKKINEAPMVMDKQNSYKEYIYNIERVYNFKTSNRKVIF